MSDEYLQNDPDRAGGLIADAQGEFVEQEPGGAFDPRAFRRGGTPPQDEARGAAGSGPGDGDREPRRPPVDDERMAGPGEEAAKAG